MRGQPIIEVDDRYGDSCDVCTKPATRHCACECGRVLCDEHELAERQERSIRQIINHQKHAAERERRLETRKVAP